jgi:phage terminase large subunit-like protein
LRLGDDTVYSVGVSGNAPEFFADDVLVHNCWFDEAAWMDEIETAWDNAEFATRVKSPGNPIHFLITSTPTGGQWVQDMEDNEEVMVRRVSTYANKANLDSDFITKLRKKHEGTRKGRQEIHGEVLRDVEGALWDDDMIRSHRFDDASRYAEFLETLDDCVVAVDPAGSKGKRSDKTGIIASGAHHLDEEGNRLYQSKFFVLGRATLKGTPTEWARATYKLAQVVNARRIVAEKNFGGDMVKQVLADYAKAHPLEAVDADGEPFKIEVRHAVHSKETRAEGTVGRYEQGLVEHIPNPTVFGDLSELEKQQVTWIPKSRGGKHPSPNRGRGRGCLGAGLLHREGVDGLGAASGSAHRRLVLPAGGP